MAGSIDVVFFDIGGVMYDDLVYVEALRRALREMGGTFDDEEFDVTYATLRAEQRGPFRRGLVDRFLGREVRLIDVDAVTAKYWAYPADALEPDVRPCLEALHDRYRLGVIANQPSAVRVSLERDGLSRFFEIWGVSDDLGLHKPDPRLFQAALQLASVAAGRSVMVGDRLDYDVRPARQVGMRAIWVLRGEAPDRPTQEQLAEPDAAVRGLAELPDVLAGMG